MTGALSMLAAFVVFILAHEAGHFFAAKALGIKVSEFFVGFGPRIWSISRRSTLKTSVAPTGRSPSGRRASWCCRASPPTSPSPI